VDNCGGEKQKTPLVTTEQPAAETVESSGPSGHTETVLSARDSDKRRVEDPLRGGHRPGGDQASIKLNFHRQGWETNYKDVIIRNQPETGKYKKSGRKTGGIQGNPKGHRASKICDFRGATGHPAGLDRASSRGHGGDPPEKGGHPHQICLLLDGEEARRDHTNPPLWGIDHKTIRPRPSTVFPVPQVEPHRETLPSKTPVLQLREGVAQEGRGATLRMLPEARNTEVYKLSRPPHGGIQGLPLKKRDRRPDTEKNWESYHEHD